MNATFRDYLEALGTVFAVFDRQDSGNVAYGVETDSDRIWVKYASTQDKADVIVGSLPFYEALRHPLVPQHRRALRFLGGQVARETDWVDGEVLRQPEMDRNHPDSACARFLSLPFATRLEAANRIFELFCLIESMGFIIEDFYDGCIIYDFGRERLHVCDLDHAHRGPYRLRRARQYGSRRFMAPEEFRRGSLIDDRTAVYTMGATARVFFGGGNGRRLFEGTDRLEMVIRRATDPQKEKRYPRVQDFQREWQSALGMHCDLSVW